MSLAHIVILLIKVSIMLVTFSYGLKATWADVTYLLRHPGKWATAFFAMNIVMLLVAIVLAKVFRFNPAVEIALIVLALSPIPPLLPSKQFKTGAEASYVYGLLVGMSLLSVIVAPLLIPLVGKMFDVEATIPSRLIAKVVFLTIIIPISLGVLIRAWKPTLAERSAKGISLLSNIMLVAGVIGVLFGAWHAIVSLIGNGTIIMIVVFVMAGLAVGHLFGGPNQSNRSALALATASRHPAVALTLAQSAFPDQKLVPAAILLYLLVSAIVSVPYLRWSKQQHLDAPAGSGPSPRPGAAV